MLKIKKKKSYAKRIQAFRGENFPNCKSVVFKQIESQRIKGFKSINFWKQRKTICAKGQSLEHHPRGQIEKESCGLGLRS